MTITITRDRAIEIFTRHEERRRDWSLNPSTDPEFTENGVGDGDIDSLMRALALRNLEMPVKSFVKRGLDGDDRYKLTRAGVLSLTNNLEDEDNHDQVLNDVAAKYDHYGLDYSETAEQIKGLWLDLEGNALMKATLLENGLFFTLLPFLMKSGGPVLHTAATSIATDESRHVAVNRTACNLLGLSVTPEMTYLRQKTVGWVFENSDKGPDFYIKRSDDLIEKGKFDSSEEAGGYVVTAFYESSVDQLWY